MKKQILILLVSFPTWLFSTDRIVQQNGPTGTTYSSISAAVAASVDGDRIVINNRTNLLPWQEDITIDKSLTFVSAVDNIRFSVYGTYTITPANGRKVEIIGMRNSSTSANIVASTTSGTLSSRTKITILSCELSGNVDLVYTTSSSITNQVSGTNLHLGNSIVDGAVFFSYGKVIGNEINKNVLMYSDLESNNDTNFIIGNKIESPATYIGLKIYNSTQFFMVFNNYVVSTGNANSNDDGLYLHDMKSGTSINKIYNNTLIGTRFGLYYGSSKSSIAIFNNVIISASTSASVYSNNSSSSFSYNAYEGTNLPSALYNTSLSLYPSSLNSDGSNAFTQGTNTGNPSNEFLDLDLTRNDLGCWGGSYSFANFYPINDGKSSRINMVTTPRVVNQGTTFKVEALGFDK